LHIIGNPKPGDIVIVDYSTNRPYVRTIIIEEIPIEEEEFDAAYDAMYLYYGDIIEEYFKEIDCE
jgi:ATP-dependent exoDNAse (exonuclease V) beta subunit